MGGRSSCHWASDSTVNQDRQTRLLWGDTLDPPGPLAEVCTVDDIVGGTYKWYTFRTPSLSSDRRNEI